MPRNANQSKKPEQPAPPVSAPAGTRPPSGPMSDEAWARLEATFGTFDFDTDPRTLRRAQ